MNAQTISCTAQKVSSPQSGSAPDRASPAGGFQAGAVRRALLASLLFLLCVGVDMAGAFRLEPSNVLLSYDIVATDLQGPAGMAIHPHDGLLYVVERNANRIARIRDTALERVVDRDFVVDDDLPDWALAMGRDKDFWTDSQLRAPTDIAFDRHGNMVVAESGQGGRLLEFHYFEQRYLSSRVVLTPWMHGDHSFVGVTFDRDDRLYLTARRARVDTALPTGSALLREVNGDWWMADYGPFSEFASPVVDERGRFLILVDQRSADIVWYERAGQFAIGAMTDLLGIRSAALLSDGTTLAVFEQADGTWSLVTIDPETEVLHEWIGGLPAVGGLCVDPRTDELYLSLSEEGHIARVRRLNPPEPYQPHALEWMLARFRIRYALPPPQWPEFFKRFIHDIGVVEPIDDRTQARSAERRSLTLPEFAEALPLIAARASVTPHPDDPPVDDPIEEIGFVLFLPNKSMFKDGTLTPSVSLFRATHASGRIAYTRFLGGNPMQMLDPQADWDDAPMALVAFPSGFQALDSPFAEEGHVRVYFIGMGIGPDYHILLHQGDPRRGEMLVEGLDGRKTRYRLETFSEAPEAGGHSLLVADARIELPGWRPLADYPLVWTVVLTEPTDMNLRHSMPLDEIFAHDVRVTRSVALPFERRLPRRDLEWRRRLILNAAGYWSSAHF